MNNDGARETSTSSYSRGGKRQTAYPPAGSLDSFLQKKTLTAGSDFLFGPNYIGIRGCFELNLSENVFYRAMIYFHLALNAPTNRLFHSRHEQTNYSYRAARLLSTFPSDRAG